MCRAGVYTRCSSPARTVCLALLAGLMGIEAAAQDWQPAPSSVRPLIKSGLDHFKRGEYEAAAALFEEVQSKPHEMTPTERRDVKVFIEQNARGLALQREAVGKLHQADQAFQQGHHKEAAALAQSLANNVYLTMPDRALLANLQQRLREDQAKAATPKAGTASPSLAPLWFFRQTEAGLKKEMVPSPKQPALHDALPSAQPASAQSPAAFLPSVKLPPFKLPSAKAPSAQAPSPKPLSAQAPAVQPARFPQSPSAQPARFPQPLVLDLAQARHMLSQARALLGAARFDEADELCQRAASAQGWGHFELTPTNLRAEIQAAKAKSMQAESARLLTEARKLFQAGQLAEARRSAAHAQQLHGPYSMWHWGDRPERLLAEIKQAETHVALTGKARAPAIRHEMLPFPLIVAGRESAEPNLPPPAPPPIVDVATAAAAPKQTLVASAPVTKPGSSTNAADKFKPPDFDLVALAGNVSAPLVPLPPGPAALPQAPPAPVAVTRPLAPDLGNIALPPIGPSDVVLPTPPMQGDAFGPPKIAESAKRPADALQNPLPAFATSAHGSGHSHQLRETAAPYGQVASGSGRSFAGAEEESEARPEVRATRKPSNLWWWALVPAVAVAWFSWKKWPWRESYC